jgi:uncharacterized protein YdhG (YjbR/CyaY superfamily)
VSATPKTVDDYLAGLPEDQQAALTRVRKTIKEAAPDATEGMSYGIPGYKFKGRPLIHFGAAKNHCAIYGAAVVWADKAKLKAYDTSKGTIRFSPENPLPDALVRKFVQTRMGEIEAGSGGYGKKRGSA